MLCQVAIGGGDQAHIGADGARAAQALELALLQHAQQLGLQLERNLADFVEEHGAAVGQLEAADALRDGAGERALLVAEQFAFQQAGGNGGAVQLDEGALPARAEVVDGARHQFLAGAGFAVDQHGGIGGRHGLHLLEHGLQRAALADDFLEAVVGADLVFQVDLFLRQAGVELFDALVGEGVIERDGHLAGHLREEAAGRRR